MNILDPRFKYVPAAKTNLRQTFARIRREQAKRTQQQTKPNERASRQ